MKPTLASVALCAPTCRLLVLEVECQEDGTFFREANPVVALLARTVPVDALEDEDPFEVRLEPVFVDDGCLSTLAQAREEYFCAAFKLVAAPWPADEDDRRLADQWGALDKLARYWKEHHQRKKATEAIPPPDPTEGGKP